MELPLCGTTAFRYYRTPPQVLAIYPPLPSTTQSPNHRNLAACKTTTDLLGSPLHRLSSLNCDHAKSKLYRTHVITSELPFDRVRETEHNFQVTSPLLTLLTMASQVTRIHLLMAMYELCGTFTVFKPTQRAERYLKEAYRQGLIPLGTGWQRVKDTSGKETDLWRRDPLVEIDELHRYADEVASTRGSKDFRWAASHVTGVCASPFEVQASILLGLARRNGGMSMTLENNRRIPLGERARAIYPHSCCYADIYLEARGGFPPVDIECQGAAVHDSESAAISDSDRFAALESAGVEVIPITYGNISNAKSWDALMHLVARKTGKAYRPKPPKQLEAEDNLRRELLIDWNTLGR